MLWLSVCPKYKKYIYIIESTVTEIQGLHSSKTAFVDQLRHSSVMRLHHFEAPSNAAKKWSLLYPDNKGSISLTIRGQGHPQISHVVVPSQTTSFDKCGGWIETRLVFAVFNDIVIKMDWKWVNMTYTRLPRLINTQLHTYIAGWAGRLSKKANTVYRMNKNHSVCPAKHINWANRL